MQAQTQALNGNHYLAPRGPTSIRKRDGVTVQGFDKKKLRNAIYAAWVDSVGAADEKGIDEVVATVLHALRADVVDVELVQDAVETALMCHHQFKVAKSYILYRHQRQEARQLNDSKPIDPRALSDYIHSSKYARYVPELLRREVYEETVARVESMHVGRYPELADEIRKAFKFVYEKRVLPSMRSMQFGGPAILKNNNRLYNCLGRETRFITSHGVRSFSDFADGTEIVVLTHTGGWKRAIVRCYGEQQLFSVRVKRGGGSQFIRATRDHQWILRDGSRTVALKEGDQLALPPRGVGNWTYEDRNPEERQYWAMGYVYGDGTLVKDGAGEYRYSMARLCGDDGRFLARFQELGYKSSQPASLNGEVMVYTGRYLKTLPSLERDGIENVTAFVRGYLDADGGKNPNWYNGGVSEFDNIQASDPEAIAFIREVFPAVGAYVLSERDKTGQQTNYGVRGETSFFNLSLGFGARGCSAYAVQEIVACERPETVWCLEVEEDHSFVLANGVVTGNCSASYIDRWEAFSEGLFLLLSGCGVGYSVQFDHVERLSPVAYIDLKKVEHHVVQDTIEGWANALKALIHSFQKGTNLEISYHKVRPAGTPLKTSGGRAPGHLKLKDSLERVRSLLLSAQGRKLRPIEAHRIMCYAADAVLSGGIRRSAMIALFSLDDSEMMFAKTGTWWQSDPWFANANNSVVLKRDEVKKKQFKRIFQMTKEWGEPGFFFVSDYDHVTNPCFHPETRLWTASGYKRIGDLYLAGTDNSVVCDRRVGKGDAVDGFFRDDSFCMGSCFGVRTADATFVYLTQREAPVYTLTTEHGHQLTVTETHEFPTPYGRKQLRHLKIGDRILLPSGEGVFGEKGTFDEGFLLGSYVGDGTSSDDSAFIDLWEPDFELKDFLLTALNTLIERVPSVNKRDYSAVQWKVQCVDSKLQKVRAGAVRFARWLDSIADGERRAMLKQRVPESLWSGSRDFIVGYIQGLFASDGTVGIDKRGTKASLDLRLSQSNPALLRDVQMLLGMFGVHGRIYLRSPERFHMFPTHRAAGEQKDYWCRDSYELVISRPNIVTFMEHIGLKGPKARLLTEQMEIRGTQCRKPERYTTTISSIESAGVSDVYCLTQPETNCVIANGLVTGQCCEINLFPTLTITEELKEKLAARGIQTNVGDRHTGYAFCNLTEINAAKLTSYEDFVAAAQAATLIGTVQAAYTEMPYLGWVSEEIAKRDALLGIGMTGIMDAPHIALRPEYQRKIAAQIKDWNRQYAARLGINSAARTTCVKPSGTTSLALNCVGSGIHAHHARRYIRRVTADELEPVFQAFKAANPHACVRKPDGKWVIEFPVHAPEGAILKGDQTAVEFLETVRSTQANWVVPGTDPDHPGYNGGHHNVSNTVIVQPDEWEAVANYIWAHRDDFTGVSLLPSTGDKDFAFAPLEAVVTEADERRWLELISRYEPVNYAEILETEDGTALSGEVACAGGLCEIRV